MTTRRTVFVRLRGRVFGLVANKSATGPSLTEPERSTSPSTSDVFRFSPFSPPKSSLVNFFVWCIDT